MGVNLSSLFCIEVAIFYNGAMIFCMVQSIRMSDELYDRAQISAKLLHRSLNRQVAPGQLLDQGMSRDELMAALIKNGHARDEQAVQSGALRQEDLYFAPPETIRNMTVHFSPRSLGEFES